MSLTPPPTHNSNAPLDTTPVKLNDDHHLHHQQSFNDSFGNCCSLFSNFDWINKTSKCSLTLPIPGRRTVSTDENEITAENNITAENDITEVNDITAENDISAENDITAENHITAENDITEDIVYEDTLTTSSFEGILFDKTCFSSSFADMRTGELRHPVYLEKPVHANTNVLNVSVDRRLQRQRTMNCTKMDRLSISMDRNKRRLSLPLIHYVSERVNRQDTPRLADINRQSGEARSSSNESLLCYNENILSSLDEFSTKSVVEEYLSQKPKPGEKKIPEYSTHRCSDEQDIMEDFCYSESHHRQNNNEMNNIYIDNINEGRGSSNITRKDQFNATLSFFNDNYHKSAREMLMNANNVRSSIIYNQSESSSQNLNRSNNSSVGCSNTSDTNYQSDKTEYLTPSKPKKVVAFGDPPPNSVVRHLRADCRRLEETRESLRAEFRKRFLSDQELSSQFLLLWKTCFPDGMNVQSLLGSSSTGIKKAIAILRQNVGKHIAFSNELRKYISNPWTPNELYALLQVCISKETFPIEDSTNNGYWCTCNAGDFIIEAGIIEAGAINIDAGIDSGNHYLANDPTTLAFCKNSMLAEYRLPTEQTQQLDTLTTAHSFLHAYRDIYVYRIDCIDDFYLIGPTLGMGGEGQVKICIPAQVARSFGLSARTIDWENVRQGGEILVNLKDGEHITKLVKLRDFAYAVKITPRQLWRSESDVYSMAHFLGALKHPNLLSFKAFYEDDNHYFFLMDLADGPELLDYIAEREVITEQDCKIVLKQVLMSLEYIHSENLVHRDIKLENFVCAENVTESDQIPRLLLIDFGLACHFADLGANPPTGTPTYMAPELLLRGHKQGAIKYNDRIDVWAAGVILCQLLTGRTPFGGDGPVALFETVEALHEPPCDFFQQDFISLTPAAGTVGFDKLLNELINSNSPPNNNNFSDDSENDDALSSCGSFMSLTLPNEKFLNPQPILSDEIDGQVSEFPETMFSRGWFTEESFQKTARNYNDNNDDFIYNHHCDVTLSKPKMATTQSHETLIGKKHASYQVRGRDLKNRLARHSTCLLERGCIKVALPLGSVMHTNGDSVRRTTSLPASAFLNAKTQIANVQPAQQLLQQSKRNSSSTSVSKMRERSKSLAISLTGEPREFYRLRMDFEGEEWSNVSEEAISLVKLLLTLDPENRPSARSALNHEWLQNCDVHLEIP